MLNYNKERETTFDGVIVSMTELATEELKVELKGSNGKKRFIYFSTNKGLNQFGYDSRGWKTEEPDDAFFELLNDYYWDVYMADRL